MSATGRRARAAAAATTVLGWAAVGAAFFVPIGKAPFNLLFALALLAFVALVVLDARRVRAAIDPIALWALAVPALYAASALWTIGPRDQVLEELASYRVLLLPMVLAPALVEARWRDACLRALLAALAIVLVLSLVQAVHPLPFARGTTGAVVRDAYGRAVLDAVVFSDRIRQSIHLSLLFLWAVGMALLHRPQDVRRALLLGAVAVLVAVDVLFLLAGRTGYLTLPALLLYLVGRRHGARGLLVLLAIGAGLVAAAVAGLPVVSGRAASTIAEIRAWLASGSMMLESGVLNASGERLAMWSHAVRMIADAPLLGHGIESYRELARGVQAEHGALTAELYHDPHNELLYVGVELGLLGIAVLLGTLAALWRVARDLDPFWGWFTRGVIVLYLAAGLANGVLNVGWTGYFFGMLLAMVAGRRAAGRRSARWMVSR